MLPSLFTDLLLFLTVTPRERGVRERGVRERGVRERGVRERGVRERGVRERGVSNMSLSSCCIITALASATVIFTSSPKLLDGCHRRPRALLVCKSK